MTGYAVDHCPRSGGGVSWGEQGASPSMSCHPVHSPAPQTLGQDNTGCLLPTHPPACMTGVFCKTPSGPHETHSRPGSSLPHGSLQNQSWLRTGPKHESQIGLGSDPLPTSAPLQDPDPWICELKLVCPARCQENT